MAQELNARLATRMEISPGLTIFRVVPDGWELPDFVPGQFAVLGMPGKAPRCVESEPEEGDVDPEKMIRRAYSIASSSVAREFLEFYVTLVPSGALTPRLFALQPGDPVFLGKKLTGMFTLDRVPEDKHVVMVATGTGLAPYMSMLRTHMECGGERKFAVFHGSRHSWELGYRSELSMLDHMCSNFLYVASVSRPAQEVVAWTGESGYVQDIWKKDLLAEKWGFQPTPDNTHLLLCGNPSMIDDMVAMLAEQGFTEHKKKTPGQVHVERYW